MKFILLLILCLPFAVFSQVSGVVQDASTKLEIIGAKVFASNGKKQLTNIEGQFNIPTLEGDFPLTLTIQYIKIRTL